MKEEDNDENGFLNNLTQSNNLFFFLCIIPDFFNRHVVRCAYKDVRRSDEKLVCDFHKKESVEKFKWVDNLSAL